MTTTATTTTAPGTNADNALTRRIDISPAYDRRSSDPDKNYGIHGVTMRWFVIGPQRAIQFVLYTNWHLKHVQEELDAKSEPGEFAHLCCHPLPADIGYHSPEPQYDGQKPLERDCEFTGGPCYYDGSSFYADSFYRVLVEQGGDALWAALEEYYRQTFGEAVTP